MQDVWHGRWMQAKGKIKEQWGKLTDDELDQTQGNIDQIVGKIQEKYGGFTEEIRRRVESMQ